MNERLETFDPSRFKQTTRSQWETAAEAWNRWGPFMGIGIPVRQKNLWASFGCVSRPST
jgi:hypothetical protein